MGPRKDTAADTAKRDSGAVRTKDNPLGIDDIGLPSGIPKDEVGRLEDIRPDPETSDKS